MSPQSREIARPDAGRPGSLSAGQGIDMEVAAYGLVEARYLLWPLEVGITAGERWLLAGDEKQ